MEQLTMISMKTARIAIIICAALSFSLGIFVKDCKAGEFYLFGAAGIPDMDYRMPETDTFCEKIFPCNPSTSGTAWQAGLGYRFDKDWHGIKHGIQIVGADWGSQRLNSTLVFDHLYNFDTGQCVDPYSCGKNNQFAAQGSWHVRSIAIEYAPTYDIKNFRLLGEIGAAVTFIDGSVYFSAPGTTSPFTLVDNDGASATGYGLPMGVGFSYIGFRYAQPFFKFNYMPMWKTGDSGPTAARAYLFGINIPLSK